MVAHQFLASGGAWLSLGGTQILLDPGPGSLVQATKRRLDPSKLDAIILSHKHLDHSSDINIMIEAMTEGGRRKRGVVFAPGDALDHDPVVLSYLRSFPEKIERLTEGSSYNVNDVSFVTPIKHRHPVETYGFVFQTAHYTFSWVTDTKYFDELPSYYESELLLINVVMLDPKVTVDHLSLPEATKIIKRIMPRIAILTHFGMNMWRAMPWELAKRLTEETGVSVIAARDGMIFDLARLRDA